MTTITLNLEKEDIDAIIYGFHLLGEEAQACSFECDSKLRDRLKQKYPEKSHSEIVDKIIDSGNRARILYKLILDAEKEQNNENLD